MDSTQLLQRFHPTKKRALDYVAKAEKLLEESFENIHDKWNKLENLIKRFQWCLPKLIEFQKLLQTAAENNLEYDKLRTEANQTAVLVEEAGYSLNDLECELLSVSNLLKDESEERKVRELEEERKLQQQRLELEKSSLQLQQTKSDNEHGDTIQTGVKLPSLNFTRFDGNVLHWQEFWDSFEAAIHGNRGLKAVEKLNYLKNQLVGEAKETLSGLALTNNNYEVAVSLLKERFGNQQHLVDAHFSSLMELPTATNQLQQLRGTYSKIEKHLRSLEALGEDINGSQVMSMIKSKLPVSVKITLEQQRGTEIWDAAKLRSSLANYLAARESAQGVINGSNEQTNRSHSRNDKYSTAAFFTADRARTSNKTQHRPKCVYCTEVHWSDECKNYPDIVSRKQRIKGHCFICLKQDHLLRNCTTSRSCVYCKQRGNHHRSLCPTQFATRTGKDNNNDCTSQDRRIGVANIVTEEIPSQENVLLGAGEQVIMQTATVKVQNQDLQTEVSCRVLFDCGSQRIYITEALANQLMLQRRCAEDLAVYTFAARKPTTLKTEAAELDMKLTDGRSMALTANIVPNITGTVRRSPIHKDACLFLERNFQLADSLPRGEELATIDILVGNDYYWDLITNEKIKLESPVSGLHLIGSKVGWILTGRAKVDSRQENNNPVLSMVTLNGGPLSTSLFPDGEDSSFSCDKFKIEDYWKLETIGIHDNKSYDNDEHTLRTFNETVDFQDGRYQVMLPWKDPNCQLESNYTLALGRLKHLLKTKLNVDKELMKKYNSVIEDQMEKGIIEEVPIATANTNRCHYIPHHPIITPDKNTTKLRIVYDASAKTKKSNSSLNESLNRGPVILEDLCGLLLRFRLNRVAILADIEKAFLQIGLHCKDRDATRFLWLKDIDKPDATNNVKCFRFARIPFGMICSPFLLGASVNFHLQNVGTPVAQDIKANLYVDNVITGVDTVDEAKSFYHQAKEIFNQASMNLREWGSNSKEFCEQLPKEDRSSSTQTKVLGLNWNAMTDELSICCASIPQQPDKVTKRDVLALISSVFDPLGFLSPAVLEAKLFLQQLWASDVDWDEPVSETLKLKWYNIIHALEGITCVSIPRFIGKQKAELLCFTDASKHAYATAVYLKSEIEGNVQVNLIFSKSRLAPKKTLSIPRLELMAVLIGIRSLNFVAQQLQIPLVRKTLWTDSQCVLHWIKSTKTLPVFVANRVTEIKDSDKVSFRYIHTTENPADIATRGLSPTELLQCQLWWHGPTWLLEPYDTWPHWNAPIINEELLNKLDSITKPPLYETQALIGEGCHEPERNMATMISQPFDINPTRYSSWTKLLRVTAWIYRFVKNVQKQTKDSGELTAQEITTASLLWIKSIQSNSNKSGNDDFKAQLGIEMDDKGIMHCAGRFVKADLPESAVYPMYLPKDHHVTQLIIKDIHHKALHVGVSQTLAQLRNNFWIPQGRSQVRKVLRNCTICQKYQGHPYQIPQMSPWPRKRVSQSSPFTYTGLDYLGPLYVKGNEVTSKVWICLFTCVATRAVHLELITDLSAQSFLLGFRRFIARRGKPKELISDNAPCFKLSNKAISKVWRSVTDDKEVLTYIANQGITWNFIVDFAPWEGGIYERLVGIVKQTLRKTIGRLRLNKEQLQTILYESESVINSRPLVYVGDDIDSGLAITPSDFLSLNPKTGVPVIETDEQSTDKEGYRTTGSTERLLERWKKGQKHLDALWKVWKSEYLLALRERMQINFKNARANHSRHEPKVGDVVHIKDKLPRGTWKLAKVDSLIRHSNGTIKGVTLQLPTAKLVNRPLVLVYPLECDTSKVEHTNYDAASGNEQDSRNVLPTNEGYKQPIRNAAKIANDRLYIQLSKDVGNILLLGSVA